MSTRVSVKETTKPHQRTKATKTYYTQDLLPFDNVEDGFIVVGRQAAAVLEVQGLDHQMLSSRELHALVKRLGELHNLQETAFQWYCRIRRRSLAPLISQYDRRRADEMNPLLRARFFEELDSLAEWERAGVVERTYYLILTQPLMAKAGLAGATDRDLAVAPQQEGFSDKFRRNVTVALAEMAGIETEDERKARQAARRGEGVPDATKEVLLEAYQTSGERLANFGIEAQRLGQDDLLQLLAEQLGGTAGSGRDGTAPTVWEEHPDHLKIGSRYLAVLFASNWPSEVHPGWLLPLVKMKNVDMEISVHYDPIPNAVADKRLRSTEIVGDYEADENPYDRRIRHVNASAIALRDMLAQSKGRVFFASVYVAVSAQSLEELRENVQLVAAKMRTMRLDPFLARLDQANAYASVLPIGDNRIPKTKILAEQTVRNLTTWNTACTIPALIPSVAHPGGIVLGTTPDGSLLIFNPWAVDAAAHEIFLAITGAGKTMDTIIEALRWLETDPNIEYFYVDPQNGVAPFARAIGGTVIDFGPRSGTVINCMARTHPGGYIVPLAEKLAYLCGLFSLMTKAELDAETETLLGAALESLYQHFEQGVPTVRQTARAIAHALGVDGQEEIQELLRRPRTESEHGDELRRLFGSDLEQRRLNQAVSYAQTEWRRGTPTLGDLMPYLIAEGATTLAVRLHNYVNPELYGNSYNGQTNVRLDNRFISFNVRDVPEAQRPIVMYIIMDFIWQSIVEQPKRRVAVWDEIGVLLVQNYAAVGRYVASLYMRARALKLRMVAIAQNIGTFLNSEYGRFIIDNSAIIKLAKQANSGSNISDLEAQFGLTEGQIATLLSAGKGEVLILAGGQALHVRYLISERQLSVFNTIVEGRAAEDARRIKQQPKDEQ